MRFWKGLAGQDARTSPDSDDPALVGRTYAIPFGTVWDAVVRLASGGLKGWRIARWDDQIGIVAADVKSWPLPLAATVLISVKLDADGQTRVDMCVRGVDADGRRLRHGGGVGYPLSRLFDTSPDSLATTG